MESKYHKFIPFSKSWINRMGFLDIINNYSDIKDFMNKQSNLGDDLLALKRASELWNADLPIDVGESGTLYRLLQFASWKLTLNKKFIKHGTLKNRSMTDNSNIINFSLEELLKLDNGTTQWATASVLLGNEERVTNPPYSLNMTFDAVLHWKKQRQAGLSWEPKYDATIQRQIEAFLEILKGIRPSFIPIQEEDYCFARVFGYITNEEGENKWPQLHGHESDRLEEMERVIDEASAGSPIDSKDHRVVQAMAMWGMVHKKKLKFTYPEAVNKSWPQFWDFLAEIGI